MVVEGSEKETKQFRVTIPIVISSLGVKPAHRDVGSVLGDTFNEGSGHVGFADVHPPFFMFGSESPCVMRSNAGPDRIEQATEEISPSQKRMEAEEFPLLKGTCCHFLMDLLMAHWNYHH